MAKRIFVDGNVLVIQDNGAGTPVEVEVPKRLVYIDRDLFDNPAGSEIIRIKYINRDDELIHRHIPDINLTDAVTSGDVAYTKGTFETFMRANLGA